MKWSDPPIIIARKKKKKGNVKWLQTVRSLGWKSNHDYSFFTTEADRRYRNVRRVTAHEKEDWRVPISLRILDETLETKDENWHVRCSLVDIHRVIQD
jgi:hypothetical protein